MTIAGTQSRKLFKGGTVLSLDHVAGAHVTVNPRSHAAHTRLFRAASYTPDASEDHFPQPHAAA